MSIIEKNKQPLITIKEARKLLGKKYDSVSDEVLIKMIRELEIFAELSLSYLTKKENHVLQQ